MDVLKTAETLDIIGDVHGHAEALESLLRMLGYTERNSCWRHSDTNRRALFLGDLIDRGPRQIRTVDIARRMRDEGQAEVLMGNHEYNAIGWFYTHPDTGRPLRIHGSKNRAQHAAFLEQVGEGSALHKELVEWMATLPIFLDLGSAKAVHACWHEPSVAIVRSIMKSDGSLPLGDLIASFDKGTALRDAVEKLLKGLECALPDGLSFRDKDGHERKRARIRWWDDTARTFADAALADVKLPDKVLPQDAKAGSSDKTPVFFGHYWMNGRPNLLGPKHACLDFSVAKGGHLTAYTFRGEMQLLAKQLTSVPARTGTSVLEDSW